MVNKNPLKLNISFLVRKVLIKDINPPKLRKTQSNPNCKRIGVFFSGFWRLISLITLRTKKMKYLVLGGSVI